MYIDQNYTGAQNNSVYSIYTVLMVSFGGPHSLKILYDLIMYYYKCINHDKNLMSYYYEMLSFNATVNIKPL